MKKAMISALVVLSVLVGLSSLGFADVRINVGVALPPIVFAAPPQLIVIPGTYVYVVPDVPEDIFFYNGYWWRPWEGRWYRSRYYTGGWVYYGHPPSVLLRVPHDWREEYREQHWRGREWHYTHVPYRTLQHNWYDWEKNKHWEQPKYRQTREIGREEERRGRERLEERGREHLEERGREHEERR